LRHFDLSLFHVHDSLEIVSDLVDPIGGLLLSEDLSFILLFNAPQLLLEVIDVVLQLRDLLLERLFILVHFCSAHALLDEAVEVLGRKTGNIIPFVVVVFLLLFLFEDLFDSSLINAAKWIQINDSFRELLLSWIWLIAWNGGLSRLTCPDEGHDWLDILSVCEYLPELFLLLPYARFISQLLF